MKSSAKNTIFSLLVAIGTFGVWEGCLEWMGISVVTQSHLYEQNVSSWRLQGNLQNQQIRTPHDKHDFFVSTNADGLRISVANKQERVDIAFLGDSNIFGWGVHDTETLSEQLNLSFPSLHFLNAGQPGHSTFQSYELFMETLTQYKPRWTILALSMHDHNQAPISDRERNGFVMGWIPHIRLWLHKNIRIYAWLRTLVFVKTSNQADTTAETFRVRDDERELMLQSMIATAKEWNGQIGLLLLPFHQDILGQSMHRPCIGWSQKMNKTYQIPVLDIRNCCSDSKDNLTFSFDRGHLNKEGISKIVPVLHAQLIKEGIVPIKK